FLLKDVGLVTCQHVLTPTTEAFHVKRPGVRYPVRVLTSDRDVDLAVLTFDGPKQFELVPYGGQRPRKGETVTVAGFPNYGPGSTLWSADGYVAGFRERMRRPRIQITCPIVAGASGSPVVDAYQRVIGVAGTGAET